MNFKMILWWFVTVFWLFIIVGFAVSITMNWLGDGDIVETPLQAALYYGLLFVLSLIPITAQSYLYIQMKHRNKS